MKTILCYGDSLTWGYNPENKSRYPFEKRWTGVLQRKFQSEVHVIEEALNGRTTSKDDPYLPNRNGLAFLPVILESHSPLDLIIILLGSNDLKFYLNMSVNQIALGCMGLIRTIQRTPCGRNGKSPEILLIAPPHIGDVQNSYELMLQDRREDSKKLAASYKKVATDFNCHFLDVSADILPSPKDGVHLSEESTHQLGLLISDRVKQILSL